MSNKKSDKLEKKVAKDLIGGKRQIASGALPFWKNDVSSDNWLVEHKYTDAKSYTVKKLIFKDVIINAFKEGKLPAMVIEFTNAPALKIAIIRYEEFLELDNYLKEEHEN